MLPGIDSVDEQQWTCKKCTLVNNGVALICEACCGSKLKSLTVNHDMTLKKGEFWICSKCTLKNSLSSVACKVCKTEKLSLEARGQARSPSPLHHSRKPKNSRAGGEKKLPEPAVKNRINLRTDVDLCKFCLFILVLDVSYAINVFQLVCPILRNKSRPGPAQYAPLKTPNPNLSVICARNWGSLYILARPKIRLGLPKRSLAINIGTTLYGTISAINVSRKSPECHKFNQSAAIAS